LLRDRGQDSEGQPILAAVGQLQFEVVEYRMKAEYGVDCTLEPLTYTIARWVGGGWNAVQKAEENGKLFGVNIVQDRWQRPVLLFRNPWKVTQVEDEESYLQLEPWAMPPTLQK
jgi:peptide chain release factor 3